LFFEHRKGGIAWLLKHYRVIEISYNIHRYIKVVKQLSICSENEKQVYTVLPFSFKFIKEPITDILYFNSHL